MLYESETAFNIKPYLLFSSGSLIKKAACNGSGIVCLADFMTDEDLSNGSLQQILNTYTVARYQPINAVFHKSYQSSLKIKCFIDFIEEKCQKVLSS